MSEKLFHSSPTRRLALEQGFSSEAIYGMDIFFCLHRKSVSSVRVIISIRQYVFFYVHSRLVGLDFVL